MALLLKTPLAMSFSLEAFQPTSCRESLFVFLTSVFNASKDGDFPPKMALLFTSTDRNNKKIEELLTVEVITKLVKLLDMLVGNTAVALAPLETLNLDGFEPGSYEILPPTTGQYASYERLKIKIGYTAVPTRLSLFDPMLMSVLYGLSKAACFLISYGLEDRITECVREEDIVSAIKNKYRDKAFFNMLHILSVLHNVYRENKQYVVTNTVMRQKSDINAILRLRARLRDLPLSSIKSNWVSPYKYDGGMYLFHTWKKEKFPDAWSKHRAPIS